jgi:hypothetical protein
MKALMCRCGAIHSPPDTGAWSFCRCGRSGCRWVNPLAGRFEVWSDDLDNVRVLGLHNGMIEAAFLSGLRGIGDRDDARWRDAHDTVTNAPGYLFDKPRRACWAAIVARNETGDITWTDGPTPPGGGQ